MTTGHGSDYPTLSLAERERRRGVALQLMEEQDLEALLCYGDRSDSAGPPQFFVDTYFTNDRPGSTVILTRRGDLLALVWSQNAITDHYQSTRNGDQVWLEPKNLRTGRSGAHVAKALRDLGLERSRIGVLGLERFGPFYPDGLFPHRMYQTILEGLPEATFVPVWKRFAELVLVKSQEELEVLRWSARAGEKMCEAMVETARAGVTEADVYAAAVQACFSAGGNTFWMILLSGPDNIAWGPPPWTYRAQRPRVIQDGDVLLAELFVTYGMLESQQQLTIAIGEVHPEIERCARVARQAYDIGIEMLRPGVRFGELVEAMDRPVQEAGGWNLTPHIHTVNPLEVFGRCGWGTANLPDMELYDRVEGLNTVYPDLELREGMCFAFEPNCAIGTRRVNLGGTVALTKDGPIEYNDLANHMQRVQT